MKEFVDPAVAAVFEAYPVRLRERLMTVRELIFDVAARTGGVGPLTETLKWGQPSYLAERARSVPPCDSTGSSRATATLFISIAGADWFRSSRNFIPTASVSRASAPCCSGPPSVCRCGRYAIASGWP